MTAFDLTESIAPKSDQLNAEDLLTGPRTFTIAEVRKGSPEQPVDVHLVEFPGRPFKPSKTVRRILVAAWGPDASTYAGRRMTLYRDPAVRFGGMDVGGIRVSHLSHIDKRFTVALTVSKGKRAPYVVEPLREEPRPAPALSPPTVLQRMGGLFTENGLTESADRLAYCASLIGRPITSPSDLTAAEAQAIVEALAADLDAAQHGAQS